LVIDGVPSQDADRKDQDTNILEERQVRGLRLPLWDEDMADPLSGLVNI
jgi:hypothetical protein